MALDEKTRLDLRNKFEELIGPRLADATMEAMPPLDYDQLATKTDVTNLGTELRAEMTELRSDLRRESVELRGDVARIEGTLRGEMVELRGDVARIEGTLRGEMTELRGELARTEGNMRGEMAGVLKTMVITQLATALALAGFVAGLN